MAKERRLYTNTRSYVGAQQIRLDIRCNSYNVENTSSTTLLVNGKQLLGGNPAAVPPIPGQNITFSLHEDEVFDPPYINITNPNPAVDIAFDITQTFYNDND